MRRLAFAAVAVAALWLAPGALGASWCGNGESTPERPDLVNGAQARLVYVIASDGADDFANAAGGIADDMASIDAWWRSQDPTRTPRVDLADFGGGCTALDIGFVRLPLTGVQVAQGVFALQRVVNGLSGAGYGSHYKRYLIYYDGPPLDKDVCGTTTGGAFAAGPSYAVVWVQACSGVPHDLVAAHELTHAFGAVPRGAPHMCVLSPGHVCDSPQDLMYPVASETPLSAAILDVGNDDYYAHSGTWLDLQDSAWLRHLDVPQQHLAVAFSGRGRVTSDVPGVSCTTDCDTVWDGGSLVTLSAAGDRGASRFVGWLGPCSGRATCAVTLDSARSVTAVFGPVTIAVRVTTSGRGHVACTPKCGAMHAGGALVLRAQPARGWTFAGWSGACKGSYAVCVPATDFAVSARATFRRA